MQKNKHKQMSVKLAARILCICLAIILVSCVGASLLQTSFGQVKIIDFKIPTDNGTWIAGSIFKPADASSDHKVPVVITCHGYLNNKEMQDSTAIELSRRGIAVIAYDAYFHGESSADTASVIESTIAGGIGMVPLVEFAYSSLPYIDNTKIGVMGHSMGGMSVWFTLMHYGMEYNMALEAATAPDSEGGATITATEQLAAQALNKVNAGLTSGNVRLSTEDTFQLIHANMGINYGKYDEGCYDLTRGNGDLSGNCYESLAAVNSVMPEEGKIDFVEIGKLYGNAENNTLRVIYNPESTHQMQHFSTKSTADNIQFFTTAFEMNHNIANTNQLWLLKEVFNAIGLVAILVLLIPASILLLEIPLFHSLKGSIPGAFPALTSPKQKAKFWGGWAISWIVSGLSYMPIAKLDTKIFPNTATMGFASIFPQQTTNYIMLWAVFNGIVGLILFYLFFKSSIKSGATQDMFGIRIPLKDFIKTLGLAATLFTVFYALVSFCGYLFHTDFRFWFVAITTFTPDKLLVMLQYLPFYFIFFFANALMTNSFYRIEGQKEWANLLLVGTGNILGIVLLNIVQYATLFSTGAAFWGPDRLYPLLTLPLIPFLFAAAYMNRLLFKATGKVWLGAMVNTMILVMVSVANTATLLPLA